MTIPLRVTALVALIAAVTLAGCSSRSAVPTPSSLALGPASLTIVDDGVGRLRSGTPYRESELAEAVPGAEIRTIQTAKEDRTVWTHAAFVGDVQALQFFKGRDGTVSEIHGVSPDLEGPNGERIGMTMGEARVPRRRCRNGKALWAGMAICQARGAKRVTLVFSIPGYLGPFDRLPPREELKRAELQRIVWRGET